MVSTVSDGGLFDPRTRAAAVHAAMAGIAPADVATAAITSAEKVPVRITMLRSASRAAAGNVGELEGRRLLLPEAIQIDAAARCRVAALKLGPVCRVEVDRRVRP